MSTIAIPTIVGRGDPQVSLSPGELREIVAEALDGVTSGERILAIIPDKTRDDNTHLLLPFAADILAEKRAGQFDALIAQGTHPPMTPAEKMAKIGGFVNPLLGQVFDHQWDRPEELVTIGELPAARVNELTGGLIDRSIPLTINRLLAKGVYDTVLVFGGTVPHEVAGFAGGAKYFFPGVAGPELTHATHWLGALATIEEIIGRVETPTRHLIEAAADFIPARVIAFTSVMTRDDHDELVTHALFAGEFRESLRQAAAVSRQIHIKYTGRKYRRVVALLDEHYDDLWVGGKASYRLGPVIEEGGELIIYAPHLTRISETHGRLIERYGYAPLEVIKELVATHAELEENLCVAAHLAHVSFASRQSAEGQMIPRYEITMATGIAEEICRRVHLGYLDYREFRREDYQRDPDTLIVERAGRDLYLVA